MNVKQENEITAHRLPFRATFRSASDYRLFSHMRLPAHAALLASIMAVTVLVLPAASFGRDVEIGGLLIDQTQTRVGAEFYRLFSLFWEPPLLEHDRDASITIIERASAQWGFWLWVVVSDSIAFQKIMKPQTDDIENDVRAAVHAVQRHLLALTREGPVMELDLSGSGI